MIAAWMVYTMLVGGLLYAAARTAEFVCRALRAPTRFVWLAAICAAIGLSANALRQREPSAPPTPARSVALGGVAAATGGPTSAQRSAADASPRWRDMLASLRSELDASRVAALGVIDRPLSIVTWLAGSFGVAYLLVALARMRRLARGLEMRELDGHRVLVSDDIGPALVGVARPDVVVPRWVLALDAADRRDILSHEREHARAGDPALAALGALLLALEPWSIALWAMFARLRLAIEADCDARVLRSHADARRYGTLLLTVYERTIGGRVPRLAFVERRSHLEERIRRVAMRGPALRSARTVVATLGSITLAAAACEATAPSKAARTSATKSSVSVVGVEPACINTSSSDRPSMTDLMDRVRGRHPEVFGPRAPNHLVLGLLLDENCTIAKDTVVSYRENDGEGDRLIAATFGDTTGFTPYRGTGFFPNPKFAGPLTVVFAVRPSQPWRERLSRSECGFGVRSDEFCSAQGTVVLRMMDSVRALIAVRQSRTPNAPIDQLFLVTLSRPQPALASRSMANGIVSYQSGTVFVEGIGAGKLLFAPSTSKGLVTMRQKQGVQTLTDLVGVAHYSGQSLTLEQVDRLAPAPRCDGPKGACYEVNGQAIEFPG